MGTITTRGDGLPVLIRISGWLGLGPGRAVIGRDIQATVVDSSDEMGTITTRGDGLPVLIRIPSRPSLRPGGTVIGRDIQTTVVSGSEKMNAITTRSHCPPTLVRIPRRLGLNPTERIGGRRSKSPGRRVADTSIRVAGRSDEGTGIDIHVEAGRDRQCCTWRDGYLGATHLDLATRGIHG